MLEGLGPQARHLQEFLARHEGPIGLTILHNGLGEAGAKARDIGQQRCRGRVEVHPHGIHRVLDDGTERAAELILVDVMLVLADADRLGLDLDEFGQRVLQAAGDRHCATQRHVEIREFARREFGRRIDRGASLRHDDLGGDLHILGQQRQRFGDEAFGLAAGRAVADGDEIDAMLGDEAQQRGLRAAQVILRLEGIERVGGQKLAGGIDHRGLDAGADAGIETEDRAGAGWCREQQVLEVAREDGDGLVLGAAAEIAKKVDHHGDRQLHAPRPVGHGPQPLVSRCHAGDADGRGDDLAGAWRAGFRIGGDIQRDHLLLGGAQHGKGAMRGHGMPCLLVIEVVGELGALLLLPGDHPGGEEGLGLHEGAEFAEQCGTLGQAFHQNVAGAVERFLHGLDGFGEEGGGERLGLGAAVSENGVDQRFEAVLARDHRLGAALGLEGQVDVLELGLGLGQCQRARQLVGELALRANRLDDGLAAVFHLAEVDEPFGELAQLRVIEATGGFLAVAGHEGNRCALVQQTDGGRHLPGLRADFLGDGFEDLC